MGVYSDLESKIERKYMYKFQINSKTIFDARLKTVLASISISVHLKIFSQKSSLGKSSGSAISA